MLTIRKEQVEVLESVQKDLFVDKMEDHLNSVFSKEIKDKGIKSEDIRPLIEAAIGTAQKYDVLNEDDIQLFIECIPLLGPEFDTTNKLPFINDTLNRTDISGEEKMEMINDFLTFELS